MWGASLYLYLYMYPTVLYLFHTRNLQPCICTVHMYPTALYLCYTRILQPCVCTVYKRVSGYGKQAVQNGKNNEEHHCALISHNRLSKTNKLDFYMNKTLDKFFFMILFKSFLIKFSSRKRCF